MSQPQGRFAVAITADDKTAKGVASAEKRVGQIPKRAGAVNKYQAKAAQDSVARSSRGMIRTLGQVEQAGARIFGGRSITSGFASRLGAIGDAASAAGEGFGAAATEGSALSGAIGVVGVAAGATIGILAAAGYAAFKLVDGWSKGASQIGRTAETIGVATDALQKFTAASERVGVDKGTATGALGGLSQTLNDAAYGRNRDALGVLTKLGIKLDRNPDGTANVGAMLPKIADAIARQNSSGRRTAARMLGIGEAALPAFAQGGAALSADMSDAEQTAYIASPGDISRAKLLYRKSAIVGQIKDRGVGELGSAAADAAEPGYDMAISAAKGIVKGGESFSGVVKSTFAPAAAKIERGGAAIERAATVSSDSMSRYLAAVAKVESNNNPNARASTSSAVGLYQFTKSTWLGMVRKHGAEAGIGWASDALARGATPSEKANILALRTDRKISTIMAAALANDNKPVLAAALGHAPDAGDLYMGNFLGAAGASRFFRRERQNPNGSAAAAFPDEAAANRSIFYDKSGRDRSLAEVHGLMERKVEIALRIEGLPKGAKVTATSGDAVAISHAPIGR
jgi:hypothetical protein